MSRYGRDSCPVAARHLAEGKRNCRKGEKVERKASQEAGRCTMEIPQEDDRKAGPERGGATVRGICCIMEIPHASTGSTKVCRYDRVAT